MKNYSTSLVIRELHIETRRRYHYTPIKHGQNPKQWQNQMESNRNFHSLLWECKIEDYLVVPDKTKLILTTRSNNYTPWYLPKYLKTCPHKNLHTDVYSSFIHNCHDLEATKMPICWRNKLYYIPIMEHYSVLKRKELWGHKKTWRNPKCNIILTIWNSRKGMKGMKHWNMQQHVWIPTAVC